MISLESPKRLYIGFVMAGMERWEMHKEQPARLAVELDYYGQHAREWVAERAGQYVVIKDTAVLDFYPDFEAAYRAGVGTYGFETDFLVKQILEYEPVFIVL
jgi:hypothetical protein